MTLDELREMLTEDKPRLAPQGVADRVAESVVLNHDKLLEYIDLYGSDLGRAEFEKLIRKDQQAFGCPFLVIWLLPSIIGSICGTLLRWWLDRHYPTNPSDPNSPTKMGANSDHTGDLLACCDELRRDPHWKDV